MVKENLSPYAVPEYVYEARRGEMPQKVKIYDSSLQLVSSFDFDAPPRALLPAGPTSLDGPARQDLRGRGAGAAIRHLSDAGVGQMRTVVDADNKAVMLLYHKLGARFEPYAQGGKPKVQVWFELDRFSNGPVVERP